MPMAFETTDTLGKPPLDGANIGAATVKIFHCKISIAPLKLLNLLAEELITLLQTFLLTRIGVKATIEDVNTNCN